MGPTCQVHLVLLLLIWWVTHSTLGLVPHLHSQVTEPEFVRFCVLDPELGDSVVRIFRAVIRENNFDSLLTKMTIPLARNSATQHLFKSLLSLWMIEVMWNLSQSLGVSCLSDGPLVFSSSRRSPQRWKYIMPSTIFGVGDLTKIQMSKDGMFWQGCRAPWMFTSSSHKMSLKGPFWDKLSETTFETATNHSPAKEETVSKYHVNLIFGSACLALYILWT